MEVAPAEAVDMALELRVAPVENRRDLGGERRDSAGRVGAVEDDDALRCALIGFEKTVGPSIGDAAQLAARQVALGARRLLLPV